MSEPGSNVKKASLHSRICLVKVNFEVSHDFWNQSCFLNFGALGGLESGIDYDGVIHFFGVGEDFIAAAIIVLSASLEGGTKKHT